MLKKILLSTALSFSMVSVAAAQDGWSGEASLSGSNTTGNTETTDVGGAIKLKKETDLWRHKFKGYVDYGKVSGLKNKQAWGLGYQIDRDLNDRTYVYGNADYYDDDFGAYQNGYFLGGGIGYKVILPDPIGWNVEVGPGYRSQKARDTVVAGFPNVPGERQNDLALRGFSDFDYQFNENVSLYNDTEIIYSKSDTYIWNEVGITANLMGNLAARASYRIDNHSDVPAGVKKTDTTTRVGVVYTIN